MGDSPGAGAGAGAGSEGDPLKRLSDRIEQASDAAGRLMDEAAARFSGAKPPPSGWQREDEDGAPAPPSADLTLLVDALRELVPDDLRRRLAAAIRELLLAVRALIDWYLERLEHRRSEPVQVQDIPVL